MIAHDTLEKLAAQLQSRRWALWRAYELNSHEFEGEDEDEPGEAEAVANLLQSEFRELRALDHALDRYREGVYGLCEECSKPIGVVRLRAIPYATLCVSCQLKNERAIWRTVETNLAEPAASCINTNMEDANMKGIAEFEASPVLAINRYAWKIVGHMKKVTS